MLNPGVSALDVNLDVKQSFVKGETISFDYTFISTEDINVTFVPYIKCLGGGISTPFLQSKSISLSKNVPLTDSYELIQVTEDLDSQMCVAHLGMISPSKEVFEQTFYIETLPYFLFDILTCEDPSCAEESKVFVKGKDIHLDYNSDVEALLIEAILTYPDLTTKQITLPTSIKAEQIGTYTLEVTASKEGYKTITKKEQFGVIEKHAEIPFESDCNKDGVCTGEENPQNCPQDCSQTASPEVISPEKSSLKQTEKAKTALYSLFLVVIVLFGAIISFLYFRKR